MTFLLSPLPFDKKSFEPLISERTFEFHYGKHHAAYVAKLNELVAGTNFEKMSLEEIVKTAPAGSIFNNAAQAWNHEFFWNCLSPKAQTPSEKMRSLIEKSFGSLTTMQEKFVAAGVAQFGSGWVWLVQDGDKLTIETTANADTPLAHGKRPILVCDVWEHAYYLDYQNRRADFLKMFIEKLVNWDWASRIEN